MEMRGRERQKWHEEHEGHEEHDMPLLPLLPLLPLMRLMRLLPLLLLMARAPELASQTPGERSKPWLVSVSHRAKWVAAAAAATLVTEAALRHHDADRQYADLVQMCRDTPPRCDKTSGGSYVDPGAESLYQATIDLDHRARLWLLGGEASILAAGTMFVLDLVYHDKGPKNIPFSPFSVYARGGRLGLTVQF